MNLSKKIIDTEDLTTLENLLQKKYSQYLQDKFFSIESSFKEDGVYATVILSNPDQSFYYPVEGRINHIDQDLEKKEAALFLIDFIDTYMEEYITENEDLFLNIDWNDFEYEGTTFQLKGQIKNLLLENKADELLGNLEILEPN